ncbi:fumarylacetoacetate hydrolase family protein [Rhodococcus sp. ARC_M6]|uniref:fumarylacetoacetate hydrolase family protein n=1 Tax=Rhodococcus sp. ARC_M6 TaxID=2928852 RepID=UPI001FB535CB|nr:fumarylacetoacetate hydrolase family protein [Rhodococcus sp. ARC_M6]MCJ0905841.1 fumarylacetoacetate hydrolase family protein [Rhodococcus sp. ARC_M6]
MRLISVRLSDGQTSAAVMTPDGARLIDSADVGKLLGEGEFAELVSRAMESGEKINLDQVQMLPVVPDPKKILCCGLNYRAHVREMNREEPEFPTLFAKFADTLAGPNDDVVLPGYATDVDWEAELAVVVGANLFQADVSEARRGIAGYTVANDISVRSWQRRTLQWLQGKAFDATTPLGPVMVTPDEFDPASGASITCTVDGRVVQTGTTDDLVFDPAELLSYISQFTKLAPGDLVLTGTPGGVGAGAVPPTFLADGSVVEVEISGIGKISNTVRLG